ncbi:hypothetical protein [Rouxiella chamberiensis]|uniref:Uncharacterized protein n=1 Tax=Rouxiella chamberiensis TaxID=1513468 RepID=A0ABY7HRM6_9GAMM|nr:hypothetical protein [Rouxiella chamberiensis]WAT02054.1 hypothetical protein O1V66_05055 [Rouxiella chamberiensis]
MLQRQDDSKLTWPVDSQRFLLGRKRNAGLQISREHQTFSP